MRNPCCCAPLPSLGLEAQQCRIIVLAHKLLCRPTNKALVCLVSAAKHQVFGFLSFSPVSSFKSFTLNSWFYTIHGLCAVVCFPLLAEMLLCHHPQQVLRDGFWQISLLCSRPFSFLPHWLWSYFGSFSSSLCRCYLVIFSIVPLGFVCCIHFIRQNPSVFCSVPHAQCDIIVFWMQHNQHDSRVDTKLYPKQYPKLGHYLLYKTSLFDWLCLPLIIQILSRVLNSTLVKGTCHQGAVQGTVLKLYLKILPYSKSSNTSRNNG